jgi:hypothetical protein
MPTPTTKPSEFLTPNDALVGIPDEEDHATPKSASGSSFVYGQRAADKVVIEPPTEPPEKDDEQRVEELLESEGQSASADNQSGDIGGLPMPPAFNPDAPMATPPEGIALPPPLGDTAEFQLPA